jgi:hydroxyacylglutathione hydrolase
MLNTTPIPAFADNYIWMLHRSGCRDAVVVDPGDAVPVLQTLEREGLTLVAILLTHHHWDHAGGVEALRAAFPECRVYGPDDRRIPHITDVLEEGERVALELLGSGLQVLEVPGHTSTHIAYLGEGSLFCGDTLFAAGCGRVFDGTFEQMAASLERIAALPRETLMYCAHEYTLANLGFAQWVEPENPALAERDRAERDRRSLGQPTVPSRLDLELATNPFLRTREPAVVAAAERYAARPLADAAEVFRALREWKDREYD